MKRIQRKRSPGWKMPENTTYVGRPTRWGNPYIVTKRKVADAWQWIVSSPDGEASGRYTSKRAANSRAVQLYEWMLQDELKSNPLALESLKGRDLACWCSLDCPCHADVLIELANR